MPRGGKRPGAGRKKELTLLERLSVGARCEALSTRPREEEAQAGIESLRQALKDEYEAASNISIERRKELTQEDRELMAFDVDAALQAKLGIEGDERPPRVFHITTKRPKGLRQKIIDEVASSRGLTTTMVNNCWKEYRRLKRETDD